MKFSFKANSLFRVRVKTTEDFKSMTEGVMVSYDRSKDEIAVKRYIRDSSWIQGSGEAVLAGYLESDPRTDQFEDIQWDWTGKSASFYELAQSGGDLKLPVRSIHPDDFDWRIMQELYKRYEEWYRSGKPDWKDKKFKADLRDYEQREVRPWCR